MFELVRSAKNLSIFLQYRKSPFVKMNCMTCGIARDCGCADKTLFRGYIQVKCDEMRYSELKAKIELEKEKLQKDMTDILRLILKPMKSWQISLERLQMLTFF